ncbi:MAG: helix-turn-helix domain-containing protein [Candidatus Cryptobacteroides sp.]
MGIVSSAKEKWLKEEIDRLMQSGLSKVQIAERLGIVPQQLNTVLNGKGGISDKFLDKFADVFQINEIYLSPIKNGDSSKKKIPLFDDVTTFGGYNDQVAEVEGHGHVAEWIDAGDWFPEATAAIRHYGDSMVEYPSGCILALKRVNDTRLILNGRNYVIETTEFRVTKQLQDDGGEYIMAYSSNKETYPDGRLIHSPIRIPKDTIRHIDLVLGCVTKEFSNGAIPIIK